MICDTTFLADLRRERQRALRGPALAFLAAHRRQPFLVTVISAGEIAVVFNSTADARTYLRRFKVLRLTPEIALVAAQIDRELIDQRLGENDNWIAGFCRYYEQPIISRDTAFDRVRGLRRLSYKLWSL
ncbi:MAG: type II toxin-antitoxin system VapC family toxin [Verrucomicrobia bacterium]|nr:type II toxin-antitoxin system VapC family toxin [Verrucomicrobiota bacterium]